MKQGFGSSGRLKTPPAKKPRRMPDQIVADVLGITEIEIYEHTTYKSIIAMLEGFKKSGKDWDDYRGKIPVPVKTYLGRIFKECREEGFILPRIRYANNTKYIEFRQVVQKVRKESIYVTAYNELF